MLRPADDKEARVYSLPTYKMALRLDKYLPRKMARQKRRTAQGEAPWRQQPNARAAATMAQALQRPSRPRFQLQRTGGIFVPRHSSRTLRTGRHFCQWAIKRVVVRSQEAARKAVFFKCIGTKRAHRWRQRPCQCLFGAKPGRLPRERGAFFPAARDHLSGRLKRYPAR